MRWLLVVALSLHGFTVSQAEIRTEVVEYKDGDVTLEGFVLGFGEGRQVAGSPCVHQWTGLTRYEKGRCRQLAELGYVAFAVDVYGKGIRPTAMQDAAKQAGMYKTDRQLYRRRLTVGLEQLKARPNVAANHLGAIGYCFGGTGVLELARSGAPVSGVVSFHGGLDSPTPADGKNIKSSVMIFTERMIHSSRQRISKRFPKS